MMQKMTTQVDYLLRETLTGLTRSGWMNWAAISTLTALLFLLGLGVQVSWQIEGILDRLGSRLEVSVYLEPEVAYPSLEPEIRALPGVVAVVGQSREEAWTSLRQELGVEGDAARDLGGNPLVDSLRVQVDEPLRVAELAERIRQIAGVEAVNYGSQTAERLARVQQAVRWASLAVTLILGAATVTVITTTIRLVILSRRQEIEVMQLVGATPLRIAAPFLLEGLFFGTVATGFAWGLLALAEHFFQRKLQQLLPFLQLPEAVPGLPPVPLLLLGAGCLLGTVGSLLAVRRALR